MNTFPKGTRNQQAFASLAAAVDWMNAAAAGEHGPELAVTFDRGGRGPRKIAEMTTVTYPQLLIPIETPADVRDYCRQLAQLDPSRFDADEVDVAECAARRIDKDGNARYISPELWGVEGPLSVLDDIHLRQYRRISGWVTASRRRLRHAQNKRRHAWLLGQLEAAQQETEQLALAFSNAFLARLLATFQNAGIEYQLEDATTKNPTPAGQFRLGY